MNQKHLKKLIEIGNQEQGYVGINSKSWADYVFGNANKIDPFLNKKFDRYELFNYCKNAGNINAVIAILSWGGMKRNHGKLFFDQYETVEECINNLRLNKVKTRKAAFCMFQNWRKENPKLGMGIGYYTKLICFLAPQLNGYIMDQWASKSINLLFDNEIVNLQNGIWVDDSNNEEVFELYCQKIDELAVVLGCTGFEAEKRIFSLGYGKGLWRNYLKEHY